MGAERAPGKVTKDQYTTLGALNILLKVSISPLQVYKEQMHLNSEEAVFQTIPLCFSFRLIWTKTSRDGFDPNRL